jgi:hypothetical protein
VIVRRARHEDLDAAARVIAAVAEEDFLGAQPPVDIDDRVARFRELIDRGDPSRPLPPPRWAPAQHADHGVARR